MLPLIASTAKSHVLAEANEHDYMEMSHFFGLDHRIISVAGGEKNISTALRQLLCANAASLSQP